MAQEARENNSYSAVADDCDGQPQLKRDDPMAMSTQQSLTHQSSNPRSSYAQDTSFLNQAGGKAKSMAQGAANIVSGAAQGAYNLAQGAATGAANMAQGAADAAKNTFGMNPNNPNNNTNNSSLPTTTTTNNPNTRM